MLYILFHNGPHRNSEMGGCVIVVHFVSYDSNVFFHEVPSPTEFWNFVKQFLN